MAEFITVSTKFTCIVSAHKLLLSYSTNIPKQNVAMDLPDKIAVVAYSMYVSFVQQVIRSLLALFDDIISL